MKSAGFLASLIRIWNDQKGREKTQTQKNRTFVGLQISGAGHLSSFETWHQIASTVTKIEINIRLLEMLLYLQQLIVGINLCRLSTHGTHHHSCRCI